MKIKLGIIVLHCLFFSITCFADANKITAQNFRFTILHTNDLHSHFLGNGPDAAFTPQQNDGDPVQGHYARLASVISRERGFKSAFGEPVLLLDSGDFFSGTLFHALAPSGKTTLTPELQFFSDQKYDAVNIGNHEFDAFESGFAHMLRKAYVANLNIPIVSSNIEFDESPSDLKEIFATNSQISRSQIHTLKKDDAELRVGIVGFLGPDAALVSSGTRKNSHFKGFNDAKQKKDTDEFYEHARKVAQELKLKNKAQIIIAMLHGGAPEDKKLLQEVPEIDIIIAGHTHQRETYVYDNRIIAQAGSYGEWLGKLELKIDLPLNSKNSETSQSKKYKVSLINTDVHLKIDDSVESDPSTIKKIAEASIALEPLNVTGDFLPNSPILNLTQDFKKERMHHNKLGQLICDSILKSLNKRLNTPAALYFTSQSLLREGLLRAKNAPTLLQFSDIFRIMSVGFDDDLNPGSPITLFYLTPQDFKKVIQFTDVYSKISAHFMPAFSSNVSYKIHNWGIPFLNRVTDFKLNNLEFEQWPVLIPIATSLYVARYFEKVPRLSYGLLNIVPRDKNGLPLKNLEPAIPEKEAVLLAEEFKRLGTL